MNTVFYRFFGLLLTLLALFACGGSDNDGGGTPPPSTYTVTFMINGGLYGPLGSTQNISVSDIEPGTLLKDVPRKPVPVHLDYTKDFAAWNIEADGSGEFYTEMAAIESDTVLYAVYAEDLASLLLEDIECGNPSAIYTLSNDVTFAASDMADPVCAGSAFKGRIYGKNNTVTYTLPAASPARDYAGFFEKLDGAYINGLNLKVNTGQTVTGAVSVGVLAAEVRNSVIELVKVSGSLAASAAATDAAAGGIAGTLDNTTVRFSTGNIVSSGGVAAGGIAGVAKEGSRIVSSSASGVLSGETVGGIAAKLETGSEISECYALNPSITGTVAAGGIAGSVNGGFIKNSIALGNLINGDAPAELGRIAGSVSSQDGLANVYARGDMLINYNSVPSTEATGKNGVSKAISAVRKNRGFFETELGWDLSGWLMPEYYEYPQTLNDPYMEIRTVAEFQAIEDNLYGKYILMNDLDFNGVTEWTSIGGTNSTYGFSGELYGSGKVIKNFRIGEEVAIILNNYTLFFAVSGILRDLRVEDAEIALREDTSSGGNSPTGSLGIIAQNMYGGILDRVHVINGRVVGGYGTGGLVGVTIGNMNYIFESSFSGAILSNNTNQRNNYADADIYARGGSNYGTNAGGIIGYLPKGSAIINSYAAGDIHAEGVTTINNSTSSNGMIHVMAGGLIAAFNDTTDTIKLAGSMAFNAKLTADDNATDAYTGTSRSQTFGRIAAARRSPSSANFFPTANITLENVYYNNAMVLDTNGIVGNMSDNTTVTELTNEADHGVTLPQPQSFYEGAGWDFEYVWKMPEGGGLPVLKWEE
jgi:hypothetical protein